MMLLIMMSCVGQSSTIDTICFPVSVIKKVLVAAEQKKVLEQQVTVLNNRISLYQTMVDELERKDSITVATYEAQIAIMNEQKAIYADQMKGYEKLLRREKRKRFFATAGGVITSGIILYLTNK